MSEPQNTNESTEEDATELQFPKGMDGIWEAGVSRAGLLEPLIDPPVTCKKCSTVAKEPYIQCVEYLPKICKREVSSIVYPQPVTYEGGGDDPPRPLPGTAACRDMAGYNAARGDFDIEHDHGAESDIQDLDLKLFEDDEKPSLGRKPLSDFNNVGTPSGKGAEKVGGNPLPASGKATPATLYPLPSQQIACTVVVPPRAAFFPGSSVEAWETCINASSSTTTMHPFTMLGKQELCYVNFDGKSSDAPLTALS
ncbi:Transcriptional adapter 2-alpha [Penaeus vannamei]|uniref:Transcriptional adapter 2-alpha n=1 Tax=Penaeus vannamei TaxID=6689 RepID=A0A3R7PSL4_PENVA|nr:Transcriptional adapter 2-alpha [Penaeus vannamei]